VNPADVAVLTVWLEKQKKSGGTDPRPAREGEKLP